MQSNIIFGLQLGDQFLPRFSKNITGGTHLLGPSSLLHFFEKRLGLSGHVDNNEHLRTEQYRQAIQLFEDQQKGTSSFSRSYEADPFATATAILDLRDELLLSGWDFLIQPDTPERLLAIATIEGLIQEETNSLFLVAGFADRFDQIRKKIDWLVPDFKTIYLNEPKELLPNYLKDFFQLLEKKDISIKPLPEKPIENDTDLGLLRQAMSGTLGKKFTPKGDGSLLIIKAKRDTELATWMAKLIEKNQDFRPSCLIPEKNRTLDQALGQAGLPSLGMLSASSARPSLQILKLVAAFLWNPIDPYKIMEFVTLGVKPLPDDLAIRIARQMAATPGLGSDSWYAMQETYFEEVAEKAAVDPSINVAELRQQYNFWFNRKRYNITKSVPKTDVIEIYDYISEWARQEFVDTGEENTSLIVLSEQARRIVDLLYALPPNMDFLTNLELERVVRTIYEPSPVTFEEQAVGHLPYTYLPSAVIGKVKKLLWWNFIQNERDHFFSRWYPAELAYLKNANISMINPKDENNLLLWQRTRPVIHTQDQLILCIPEMVNGSSVFTHPLFDELHAYTTGLENITLTIGEQPPAVFQNQFNLPTEITIAPRKLAPVQPFIKINDPELATPNEHESFTSLNDLFYYPYQWVFRHKAKLQGSSILSIVKDVTLMGNLSHRFFELLFKNDVSKMTKASIAKWVDDTAPGLLAKEGTVLLMYGREPEKISFLNKVKFAAWSLVQMIQENGWTVKGTELGLGGSFEKIPIKGKADLVLERGDEMAVVDLKWRGGNWRSKLIQSEEDLQLVMYSRLMTEKDDWTHTAYFILESGKMISRNNLAFGEATAVTPDVNHEEVNARIWDKMEKTYRWRLEQLKEGAIEVRTAQTSDELDEEYGGVLMDLLEMQSEDAPFDNYRVLINVE